MSTESSSNTRNRLGAEPDWYEPYAISLGIRVGNVVYVSGEAAVDERGETVGGADFDAQARQVFPTSQPCYATRAGDSSTSSRSRSS